MKGPSWEVYTDGSRIGPSGLDGGPGGYGCYFKFGEITKSVSVGYFKTTNNRMEILATIVALESFQEPTEVTIYSDSQYTIDGITKWVYGWIRNQWKTRDGNDVKNVDLWKRLYPLMKFHKVNLVKVPAHSGVEGNEIADQLAKAGAAAPTLEDEGYIPASSLPPKPKSSFKPWFKRK